MLRLRHSGGNAGFRGAQNTAPSGVSRPFFGAGEHSFRLFLQEVGLQGARPLRERPGNSAHVEIFKRAWQTFETCLAVWRECPCLGHAWRAASCSLLRISQGSSCAAPPCPRGPLTMHDPRNRICRNRPGIFSVVLSDNENGLPSPCKDLHTSVTTAHPCNGLAVSSHSSCKNRRKECSPAPKKGRETPEGAVFCALRNLSTTPRTSPVGALNAQRSMRISYPAPAPCRSGGGSEGDEGPPLIPITFECREVPECRGHRGCLRRNSGGRRCARPTCRGIRLRAERGRCLLGRRRRRALRRGR